MALAINKDTIADLAGSEFKRGVFVGMQNLGGLPTVGMAENVAQVSSKLDGAVGPNVLNVEMMRNPVAVNLTPNDAKQAENNDIRLNNVIASTPSINGKISR
jgi:hypothetical protein